MIELESIRDKVRELAIFNHVGNAVDAATAIADGTAPAPAAYISNANERAAPNKNSTGRHTQMVRGQVSVLFCIAAQRAADDAPDEVEAIRQAIIMALTGWEAAGAGLPFDFASYSLRFSGDGLIWGECLFTSAWLLHKG